MTGTLVCVSVIALIFSGVFLWLWHVSGTQTADYEIETYLNGSWDHQGFASAGRVCGSRRRLEGTWREFHVVIDLTMSRRSLLSLSENYVIRLSRAALSNGEESAGPRGAFPQPPSHPASGKNWEIVTEAPDCVIGRARFHVSLCRRPVTPFVSKDCLEQVLSTLECELAQTYAGKAAAK